MVAGPEPQNFDVEIAIAARKRQYAAADDKHRLRQRTGLEQPVALVIGAALQFAGGGRALGGRQRGEDLHPVDHPFGLALRRSRRVRDRGHRALG